MSGYLGGRESKFNLNGYINQLSGLIRNKMNSNILVRIKKRHKESHGSLALTESKDRKTYSLELDDKTRLRIGGNLRGYAILCLYFLSPPKRAFIPGQVSLLTGNSLTS